MPRSLALFLACCLPLTLAAQSMPRSAVAESAAMPGEPAQQVLDAWLEAFNTGERASLEAFRDRYQPSMDVDRLLEFRGDTGGFRLVRREPSTPDAARALLQERESDTVARIEAVLEPGKPVRVDLRAIEPPDDLRVARLPQREALDALVAKADAQAVKDAFSGVLLVARGDDVLLQRAWGLADRTTDTPVAADTRFRIGSMNKMFTAVATLQLVQAGKLSLDGTVGDYLPGYPNADVAKVTVRQLLTHSGGTGDIFGPQFDARRLSLKTHDDYVRLYGTRAPEHAPAGRPAPGLRPAAGKIRRGTEAYSLPSSEACESTNFIISDSRLTAPCTSSISSPGSRSSGAPPGCSSIYEPPSSPSDWISAALSLGRRMPSGRRSRASAR